jgi:cell division GTPase FtsZ
MGKQKNIIMISRRGSEDITGRVKKVIRSIFMGNQNDEIKAALENDFVEPEGTVESIDDIPNFEELPDLTDAANAAEKYGVIEDEKPGKTSVRMAFVGGGQGGCIDGKTNIYVSKYGIIHIEDFFEKAFAQADVDDFITKGNGDIGIKLHDIYTISMDTETGCHVRKQVMIVWRNRALIRKKITTNDNKALICSTTHPSFVLRPNSRKKIFARSITNGLNEQDVLLDTRGYVLDVSEGQNEIVRGVVINEDIAWLMGLFAGNGHMPLNANEISFYSDDDHVIERARKILDGFEFVLSTSIWEQPGCKRLTAYGLPVSEFFASAFEYEGGSKVLSVRIPQCISASSIISRLSFLAGAIDSDGTVSPDWCETEIATCSKLYVDDLACLGSTLGMRGVVSESEPHGKGRHTLYKLTFSGKINHGPLLDVLASIMSHQKRKLRIVENFHKDQKSFATSIVPLKFNDIEPWLRLAGFVNGNQTHQNHGICIKEWIRGERHVAIPTFHKLMDAFNDDQTKYLKQISSMLCGIKSIDDVDSDDVFYDLTVDETQNYFAGTNGLLLTHNSNLVDHFWKLGYRRCLAINTAYQDMGSLTLDKNNQYVLEGFNGAGKNPKVGKEAFEKHYEDILRRFHKCLGKNVERIMLCIGAGGGSGTGGIETLISVAQAFFKEIDKPSVIGVIVTTPEKTEKGAVQKNAAIIVNRLNERVKAGEISPLIIVDNGQIARFFPGESIGNFYPKANQIVCGIFDRFNTITAYASPIGHNVDGADYKELLTGGLMTYGQCRVEEIKNDTTLAEAMVKNIKNTLLCPNLDLTSATNATCLIVANDVQLARITKDAVNKAIESLSRVFTNPDVKIHLGIYKAPSRGVSICTAVSGVKNKE